MSKYFSQISLSLFLLVIISACGEKPIDRHSLVNRNNIKIDKFDPLASLAVGNGNFSFNTDITGLQTFYKDYENGVSLGTMSNWGWHSNPNVNNFDISESYKYFEIQGRKVPFEHQIKDNDRGTGASNYFRENAHRLHLGIIRLKITKENGEEIEIVDVKNPIHQLDMWSGKISSKFEVEGESVEVETYAHQDFDMISARVVSPLISKNRLSVEWLFPYGKPSHVHSAYNFDENEKHTSTIIENEDKKTTILRKLDETQFYVTVQHTENTEFSEVENHKFKLEGTNSDVIEFSTLFSELLYQEKLPLFAQTAENNIDSWKRFWLTGGAVDFSECKDERAKELERRVILSQYITKISGSGFYPPQETGLTFNSWYGKFHLEMVWWHSAQFANWQRPQYMEDQLDYFFSIYDVAEFTAKNQGYKGVRWPKMIDPKGQNSPSSVGSYLIWQQPHPIYFAEQLYRQNPSKDILEKYKKLVFATADFMADFPIFNDANGVYDLAPPLIPAQEHWSRETTYNPPFELSYWYWGLSIAQKWKERLDEPIDDKWEDVRNNLPTPVAIGGLYMGVANAPDSYTLQSNMRDHPMVLGTLGILPLWDKIDEEIMRNTLKVVMEKWSWDDTWGWDYPMTAMCATRLLEPEIALDALLMDVQKNTYLVNGHNYQDERLRIYQPGNGGLLKAVALMCAGWEGNKVKNPGFPKDGNWNVKWENLTPDF